MNPKDTARNRMRLARQTPTDSHSRSKCTAFHTKRKMNCAVMEAFSPHMKHWLDQRWHTLPEITLPVGKSQRAQTSSFEDTSVTSEALHMGNSTCSRTTNHTYDTDTSTNRHKKEHHIFMHSAELTMACRRSLVWCGSWPSLEISAELKQTLSIGTTPLLLQTSLSSLKIPLKK